MQAVKTIRGTLSSYADLDTGAPTPDGSPLTDLQTV